MTIYEEIALEIKDAIKDDLFDSDQFDKEAVVEVLERNFNMTYQVAGKVLLEGINMFSKDTGFIISDVPGVCMAIFMTYGYEPIISGHIHPNYDINNRYIGYTKEGIFYRMQHFDIKTRIIKFFKEKFDATILMLLILFLTLFLAIALLFAMI